MVKHILFFIAFTFLVVLSISISEVPNEINYQGRLTDSSGNPVADSTYSITFRLYDVESGDNGLSCGDPGANCLWTETQDVQTSNGLFNVRLGSINPLTSDLFMEANRWLGITVDVDSEMTPRQKFMSSAYALRGSSESSYIKKAVGIMDIPPTTTIWDLTYVDIHFSEGELNTSDQIIVELWAYNDVGANQYLDVRCDIDNTTSNPYTPSVSFQDGGINFAKWNFSQRIVDSDKVAWWRWHLRSSNQYWHEPDELITNDSNIFTTAWTLRLNFRFDVVSISKAEVRYWVYIKKGDQ